ncbi:Swarming motility protein SwrB [Bacillus velezensis]
MSTLLWLLCFVLHGVLLYAVIILYTRFSALKETERQQKKILEETENTLAAFLLELKEENERLEDAKSRNDQAPDAEDAEPRPEPKKEPDIPDHMEKLISATERAESDENNGAHSFEERVSELYEQGLTPAEIAKRMQSGKTEIELFLKFRGKAVKDS